MSTPNQASTVSTMITPVELAERIRQGNAPRMIDVREVDEYENEHIPGSELFPLSRFNVDYQGLGKDEEIVLICRSGNRSGMAQQFLVRLGYTKTRNMVYGMMGWSGSTESGR